MIIEFCNSITNQFDVYIEIFWLSDKKTPCFKISSSFCTISIQTCELISGAPDRHLR